MAEYRESRAPEMQEAAPKSLHHVDMVHHYHTGGRPKMEKYTFGKDEHAEMAAHIKQHFPQVAAHLAMPGNEVQAASEPASEDVNA